MLPGRGTPLPFDSRQPFVDMIVHQVEKAIVGKRESIELAVIAFLCGGHMLLEDVPGTGKTVLIRALSKSIQAQFRRIQCNPDLLPSDITGVSIYHPKTETFQFHPGPIMTNILLIDEINRATTKTQSALLEAMEEEHVTVDGELYPLPRPFLLLATQNPIDFDGTYVLPEAQLDRFMFKFSLGYPDEATECRMAQVQTMARPVDELRPVMDNAGLLKIQERVKRLHVDDEVIQYAVSLVRSTRKHPEIRLGASPRATLALVNASKAYAYLQGRLFVIPDDVKRLTPFVLGHRLVLETDARLEGKNAETILEQIIRDAKVPVRLER